MTAKLIMTSAIFGLFGFQCALALYEIYTEARNGGAKKKTSYDFRETFSNLCVYNLNIFKWLTAVPVFIFYNYLFSVSRPWHYGPPGSEAIIWLLAFFIADFVFYWFHVLSHRWNLLWGAHLVHHQPAYFNLSVGGRTGILEKPILAAMALPLALIGIPPGIYYSAAVTGLVYMGWTHTRAVGRLGLLESILITPHHHQVHHYKDISRLGGTKNFGGVFIIWDKIFGTFWEDQEKASHEFGLGGTPAITSPFRSQSFFYRHLFSQFFKAPAKDRLKLLFSHYLPERPPQDLRDTGASTRTYGYYDWFFCILLLILTYQSTAALTLGTTLRLAEGAFDASLFIKLAVACLITLAGIFQISEILYGQENASIWARTGLLLVVMVASSAFAFLSPPSADVHGNILYFVLGSRAFLALGALVNLR